MKKYAPSFREFNFLLGLLFISNLSYAQETQLFCSIINGSVEHSGNRKSTPPTSFNFNFDESKRTCGVSEYHESDGDKCKFIQSKGSIIKYYYDSKGAGTSHTYELNRFSGILEYERQRGNPNTSEFWTMDAKYRCELKQRLY